MSSVSTPAYFNHIDFYNLESDLRTEAHRFVFDFENEIVPTLNQRWWRSLSSSDQFNRFYRTFMVVLPSDSAERFPNE